MCSVRTYISAMLSAETKKDFCTARKNINKKYTYHNSHNYATLKDFWMDTESIPNPKKYANRSNKRTPSKREIIVKESILTSSQHMATFNIVKYSVCLECHMGSKPYVEDPTYVCSTCTTRNDPDYFLDNNLHPIWCIVDNIGNCVCDDDKKEIAQYTIPHPW